MSGSPEADLAGDSLFLDYAVRISYGDYMVDVRVEDRLYVVSTNVLINESSMGKFGVRVGSMDPVSLLQQGERCASH